MWKFVSRRIRDTIERSANHFDKRSATGIVNSANVSEDKDKRERASHPCCWFSSSKCWRSSHSNNDTNSSRWNFEHLNRSWIGAITWSSALVIGWYTSQLIHLKLKYNSKENKKTCLNFKFQLHEYRKHESSVSNLLASVYPYINSVNKNPLYLRSRIEKIVQIVTPTVYLVSNDHQGEKKKRIDSSSSGSSASPDHSDDTLGDVLNSIENRLGLAAIENGQQQDGLNLLRSAANRNHAPALYNLGLCYEMGLGVAVDEKTAMELYRSAAALEHPGALYNLGIYYGQGRGGLVRDLDTATRLLRLAAVQGQRDAVDALRSLNVDPVEPLHHGDIDPWAHCYKPYTHHDIVPTHTTLFVENVHYLHDQNCETTLY